MLSEVCGHGDDAGVEHDLDVLHVLGAVPVTTAEHVVGADRLHRLILKGLIAQWSDGGEETVKVVGRDAPDAARRRQLVREIAMRIESLDGSDMSPITSSRLARLMIEGSGRNVALAQRACKGALMRGDLDLARELTALIRRTAPQDVELAHLEAMILEAQGQHGAAATVGSGRIGILDPGWIGRWSSNLFMSTGRVPSTDHVSDRHNEIAANRAWIELIDGDVPTVLATIGPVLEDARSSPQAVVWACVTGSVPAALQGHRFLAQRLLDHAGSIIKYGSDELSPFAEMQHGLFETLTRVRLGELDEAEADVERMISSFGSALGLGGWSALGGIVARERGDFEAGLDRFDAALAAFPEFPFAVGDWVRSERAVCEVMVAGATHGLATPHDAPGLFRSCLHRNNAWILAARGQLGNAQDALVDATKVASERGQLAHQLLATLDIARFGKPHRALELLPEVGGVDTALAKVCVTAVQALASNEVDALIRAHLMSRRVGIEPLASELASRAIESAARRRGPGDRVRVELSTAVSAMRSPLLDEFDPPPTVLTRREHQIAQLAIEMSSPAIADRLGITTRTVDNLLSRVYTKAGVSGREGLRRLVS